MKLESDDRRYSDFSNYAMRGLNIENNFLGLLDVKTGVKGNIGRFGEIWRFLIDAIWSIIDFKFLYIKLILKKLGILSKNPLH